MSEAFLNMLSEFTFRIVMIILLSFSTLMLLSAYFTTQNMVFYYAYVGALFFILFYMVQYVKEFKRFKENLYLFIPSNSSVEVEPLNLNVEDVEDLSLKVCLLYQKGYGFESIAKELNLSGSEQAKRLLRRGLTILLGERKE